MPVPTAGLADVGPRDPHPLVLGGRRQHLLQQLAVAGLEFVLLAQSVTRPADPLGERVADPLELVETGDARRGKAGRDPGIEREARKGLGTEAGKLMFEPPDLPAQLSAREALVASHTKRSKRVSFEQTRHKTGTECRSRRRGRKRGTG